jgi:hypothetical protein
LCCRGRRVVDASLCSDRGAVFSTYIGGTTGHDSVRDVAIDSSGNFYLTGGSSSPDFPVMAGSHDITHGGSHDVFVTKLDPAGAPLWSTWLGGPNHDRAHGIEVDDQGNVIVAGRADDGFPTTAGVLQPSFFGDSNPRAGRMEEISEPTAPTWRNFAACKSRS